MKNKEPLIPSCSNCKNFGHESPQFDQPYPEFWCSRKHWDGISCYDDLYKPIECNDHEPLNAVCDCCGQEHPLMENNKDGSWTCVPCLNKIDDGNDIDNYMGCN